MTQIYRTMPHDRHLPSRSRLKSVRPSHERAPETDLDSAEPPVLLQLADLSDRVSPRGSRRPPLSLSLPAAATPLPVPPVMPPIAPVEVRSESPPEPAVVAPVAEIPRPEPAHVEATAVHGPAPEPTIAPSPRLKPPVEDRAHDEPTSEPNDDSSTFWDRVGSYRPSLPVLLGLVLATICIAYIYRPQETPPKRRGSLESTESKRLFDKELDAQRPKPLSVRNEPRDNTLTSPPDAAIDEPRMPTLDMPANAPANSAARSANQLSQDSSESSSLGDDPAGRADAENPRAKLAARPSPTEHFHSTPPPTMPDEPQVQPEATDAAGQDEEGPPPDISGRNYPQTNPMNFYYRPVTPETREASRPTTSQGETR